MRHFSALLAMSMLWASSAAAGPPKGFYAGFAAGNSTVTLANAISTLDFKADKFGYKALLGYQFFPHFAVEGSFIDYGDAHDTLGGRRVNAHFVTLTGNAIGMLSAGPVDFFLEGGIGAWRGKVRNEDFGSSDTASHVDPTIGFGVQWRLRDTLALRAEAYSLLLSIDNNRDGKPDDDLADIYTLGLLWRFR